MRTERDFLLLAVLCSAGGPAWAQAVEREIGIRPLVLASQGEPANDMLGIGIVGTWQWRDDWFLGAAVDSLNFDYERPQSQLGLSQEPSLAAIDGSNTLTRLAGWVERRYDLDGSWDWFWTAGLAFASVDADVVSGPTASGGTFDIATEADNEIHLLGSAGLRRPLGNQWIFSATFHLEHHLTDYRLVDRVSGATGKIGSHTPVGVSATFSYRF
ncbi:MAG TPA: hypothetical protein VLD39_01695 [Gammaproteobacteria bacterium]|nr:hypothetical protein [Gammaproteobacteria bacterium]